MPRTTIDIDGRVLLELKRRARRRGTTVGRLTSELLARALADGDMHAEPPRLEWRTAPMGALLELRDREALHRALDGR